MIKRIVCCSLCFFVVALAWPQGPGLLVSDARYAEIPLLPAYSGVKYNEVPAKVSLKKFCPVPGDQRQTGACVGWAVGYGALTIQRAIAAGMTDQARITREANSAAFVYNQVRRPHTDCFEGAYIEDALALLKARGDCLERSFNYDQHDCRAQPDTAQLNEARQYRALDYAAVFALDEDPKSKIGKTCKILATNTPLIVGIGVTRGFFDVLPGASVWNPDASEAVENYHAMVLVGYNSVEKYVELLNSFGASWGQNGFIRLPYDDFERLCRYAYVMVPATGSIDNPFETGAAGAQTPHAPAPAEHPVLGGEFVFRRPAGFVATESGEELMYFEEIKTRRDEALPGLYTTEQEAFAVGDVFQLVAREVPRGRYVYVFSQGPDGSVNQHFPRKKTAVASAGFVLDHTVEIVVPGEESLLQLSLPGHDHLCILYSLAPVPDLERRLRQVETSESEFPRAVQTAFGDLLIPPGEVRFFPEKMAFTAAANPTDGRFAAVLVLRVKAE